MSKGARLRQAREAAARRVVVIDLLEVGEMPGVLTFRGGQSDHPPVLAAIPAAIIEDALDKLYTATIDAEEQYWQVLPHVLGANAAEEDQDELQARVARWVLGAANWQKIAASVPGSAETPLYLITAAGHVGMVLAPPLSTERVIALFDPAQLHRVGPSMAQAAGTRLQPEAYARRDLVDAALADLASRPWPPPKSVLPQPTEQEAAESMQAMYGEHLRREPYMRPPENDVPSDSGDLSTSTT